MDPARTLLVIADRVRSFHTDAARSGLGEHANAVLIVGGNIAAVGAARDIAAPPGADLLELPGTTITPGLTDAHIHLTEWALARRDVDLSAATSPEQAASMVRDEVRPGPDEWIRGRGWNPHRWAGAQPHRALLDAVVPGRLVALQSHDMHSLWASSAALERAGIDRATEDPPGGRIVRDEEGRPTGLLLENAGPLVARQLPKPSATDMLAAVRDAQAELHALGITGIHSLPGVHLPEPDPLSTLETLRARGELRLRVLQHLPLPFLDDALRLGLRSGFGGDWIRIGGIKFFLDGALGSRTAWMRSPYETSADCGLRMISTEEFAAAVGRAAGAGLASTVHAIGDAAVALALDVLREPGTRVTTMPHRIEHVQCLPDDRLALLPHAGVVCSVQPAHLMTDWPAADQHWGPARSRWTYAFRTLLDRGATLAGGSDAPVEPVDPRLGLFAATRRTDREGRPHGGWMPGERLTLEEAFHAYTVGPAIAAGRLGREGQLTPGAVGDLIAWDGDPFAAQRDPLDLVCVATLVAGEVVHS